MTMVVLGWVSLGGIYSIWCECASAEETIELI